MMADFGMPLRATEDLLELAADAIDLANIAVGTAALYSETDLRRKISSYRERDVVAFPGGQFLEYAIHHDVIPGYLADARRAGFAAIEVSNNRLHLSIDRKRDLIARAVGEHGFQVLGEVGSKASATSPTALIRDAEACLDAGAWKVLVEAAEFFTDGVFDEQLAAAVTGDLPADDLIFELPGSWIPGIVPSDIHGMQVWLLEHVGVNVNVGNVAPADVLAFEALRRNLGVHMHFHDIA